MILIESQIRLFLNSKTALFLHRERHHKGGAAARRTFNGDRPLIQLKNPFHHRKSQTVSQGGGFIFPEKFIENMIQSILVHADACICNCNQETAFRFL